MKKNKSLATGLIYLENAISAQEKAEILKYIGSIYPIWEQRFSKNNPPPEGQENRWLLRPVYWLGNWQFACLNYYHPPKGLFDRCVQAENYPPVLQKIVMRIEDMVHTQYADKDIPKGWHLNTCLINFYGDKLVDGKKIDCARVGEHKDFEPGPVGSISFGERALIQFVTSDGKGSQSKVFCEQWLNDSSLQIFGGDKFKKQLFHRVQRVDKKLNQIFPLNGIDNFETRRINFTFRYVPNDHIADFAKLKAEAKEDVQTYVEQLAVHSEYWKSQLIE